MNYPSKYPSINFQSLLLQHSGLGGAGTIGFLWKVANPVLFVLCSNERPTDAQMRYFADVLLNKPGFGTRCMVDEPLEWVILANWSIYLRCSTWFHGFVSPTGRDFPCNNITTEWEMPLINPVLIDKLASPEWNSLRPSPDCQCSTPSKLTMLPVCPEGAGGLPPPQVGTETHASSNFYNFWGMIQASLEPYSHFINNTVLFQRIQSTGDVLMDLTGRNISDYLVKIYPSLIRTR